MRIAIDIRVVGKKRTGDETVFFHLTKHLIRLFVGTEHDLFLLTDCHDSDSLSSLALRFGLDETITNVTIVSLPCLNRFVWTAWVAPQYLRREHIDVYHTQYIVPFFISPSTKVVTHVHDVSFRAFPHLIAWSDRFFLWLLMGRSLRRADCVIAVSSFTAQEIVKYYPVASEKIAVVPNALGDDYLQTVEGFSQRISDKYHLPKKYLLYVGTLQPRKNIPYLIRTFACLAERVEDVCLVIVGNLEAHNADPLVSEALEALPSSVRLRVFFPGYVHVDDLPYIYFMARAFVFPSLYEGFSIPLLEAFSAGVPVVASDIAVHREVAGKCVFYVPTDGLAEFCEKLYIIVTDDEMRSRYISRGRERLVFYSWDRSARIVHDLYMRFFS
ncbi:MAG: glycosyltransferase family 4 protein [Candidatus Moranbacteria bacterium]|nr:glycosyltransferase family 4 protein [Candidatus Moranbacteria bacterium]